MEEQKGRVGIAVILAVLLASAVVSWTVSAMADDDGEGATLATSGTVPAEGEQEADPTDPENAKPFDGPKHKTYDALRHCYWRSPCSWSRSSLCSPVGGRVRGVRPELAGSRGSRPRPAVRHRGPGTIRATH